MSYTLSEEDRAALAAAEPRIKAIKDTITRLERIGIDVTAEKEQLERAEQIRRGFLREFGGGRRTGPGRTA